MKAHENGARATHAIVFALVLAVSIACGCKRSDTQSSGRTFVFGAYTTPREAYGTTIIPAFKAHWKQKTGEDLAFQESYQGSGAQARAIVEGFEADVVALSLEPDLVMLEKARLVTRDWRAGSNRGVVSRSVGSTSSWPA